MNGAKLSSCPTIRCRLIESADIAAIIRLLAAPFPYRPADYWKRGFERLSKRELPNGVPRFGYVLEREGELVGVLLTIYRASSIKSIESSTSLLCNLSTWYVLPQYRTLSTVLDGQAMRDKSITYINLSPDPHTIAIHEARGFRCYCRSQMMVIPALCLPRRHRSVRRIEGNDDIDVPAHLRELVRDHRDYGCVCLLCREGSRTEVVILQRLSLKLSRRWTWLPRLPAVQLVYGPAGADLSQWLGAIGRYLLLRKALPFLLLDVNERISGAVGLYLDAWRPRYARGPTPVAVGDLSYTEITIFGP